MDYIWDRENKGENHELQLVQNKCLRLVYKVKLEKDPVMTTDAILENSKCKKLIDRRDMHLLFYAFTLKKVIQFLDVRILPTRAHMGVRLLVPRSVKPIVLRSALYRGIIRWNSLKAEYTVVEDLNEFKKLIKRTYPNCFM